VKIEFFYHFAVTSNRKEKITMLSLRFVRKIQSVQPYQAMLVRNSTTAAAAATPAAKTDEKSKDKKAAAAAAKASAPAAKVIASKPKKEETVYKRFPEHIKYKPLKPEGNGCLVAFLYSNLSR
jgi:hypothetical protein